MVTKRKCNRILLVELLPEGFKRGWMNAKFVECVCLGLVIKEQVSFWGNSSTKNWLKLRTLFTIC